MSVEKSKHARSVKGIKASLLRLHCTKSLYSQLLCEDTRSLNIYKYKHYTSHPSRGTLSAVAELVTLANIQYSTPYMSDIYNSYFAQAIGRHNDTPMDLPRYPDACLEDLTIL